MVYGNLVVAKDVDHLSLIIGPKKVQWSLMQCQNNTFKAFWPSSSKLDFPMLLGKEGVVKFIPVKATNVIGKMQVNYLNADGGGVFVKK
ncbi:MAG: hypothetical protein M1561_00475 [Gammaproteobacteria bacterium]|nr:hypothetical protein [Gammaproteobacteria bacterium]